MTLPTTSSPPSKRSWLERVAAAAARERLLRSFYAFIRAAWPIVEPGAELVDNWHLEAMADHLQAVTEGDLRKLIINVPPRHTKSLTVAVFWPAWEWARNPGLRWLFASHKLELSIRDSVRMRRLIESDWYRSLFPNVRLEHDQNQKSRYETTAGGLRVAMSFGGSPTGEGGQRRVIDDPHGADDVYSEKAREDALRWWRESWSTRTIDPKTDAEVVIMQRLHERDLSGFLLDDVGGYTHLMLPLEYEPARRCKTSIGFQDPRRRAGQILDPHRFGKAQVEEWRTNLGPYGFAGQAQQSPTPPGGGILKRWWWRYWIPEGMEHLGPVTVAGEDGELLEIQPVLLPRLEDMDRIVQSWDMAFKATKGSSRVAGQVWAQKGANAYLLANTAERRTFTQTLKAVEQLTAQHPEAYTKLVEAKANGPAVVDALKDKLGGFIEAEPYGSKEARAHAISPRVSAGNALLPHPALYPWVEGLRKRLSLFPSGAYNDEVDSATQALEYLPWAAAPYQETRTKIRSARADPQRGRRR